MAFSPRLFCRRLLPAGCSLSVAARMSTATSPATDSVISKIKRSSTSPWLMLPPSDNSGINHRFYSFAESRIVTRPGLTDLNPINDLRVRGSSHGWLALFSAQTLDLILYNPISLRQIRLPPLSNFPKDSRREVTKVTLSSSPDEDEHNCRAVVNYIGGLAYCCPGRSKEWTPIGATAYKDFVYSTRENLFFGLTRSYEFETWDLSDPSSPRMIKTIKIKSDGDKHFDNADSDAIPKYQGECLVVADENAGPDAIPKYKMEYLVVADEHFPSCDEDDVLLVTRYLKDLWLHDDSISTHDLYAPMTTGFHIDVYDEDEGGLKPFEEKSLGGFTLFIGCHSDSVAVLSTTRFPELKPDSIYFTDPFEPTSQGSATIFSGYDFGIFDYEYNAFSGCYIPSDALRRNKVLPSTMWFFPTICSV